AFCHGSILVRDLREPDDETCTAIAAIRRNDRSAVAADDLPRDRQAQPDVIAAPLDGTIGEEAFEDTVEVGLRKDGPSILDGRRRLASARARVDVDRRTVRRKADGVGHEILEHLRQSLARRADAAEA